MKNLIYTLVTFSLVVSCITDDKPKEDDIIEITEVGSELPASTEVAKEDAVQIPLPPPSPKPSDEKEKIQKKLSQESSFLQLGCCENESKREQACCCDAILIEYANLFKKYAKTDPSRIYELSTKDPLLGACKKLMVDAFDAIDNPLPPKDSIDYGDLF